MAVWFWYAVVAALLYGAHQIFTRLAAERIGEGLGGFVVEASAALSILIYLACLLADVGTRSSACLALIIRCSLEPAWELARSRSFCFFKKVGRSQLSRRFWPAARRSWLSPASCFSMRCLPGSGYLESRWQSPACFCCAGKIHSQTASCHAVRLSNMNLQSWLLSVFGISIFMAGLRAEPPVQAVPSREKIFRVPATRFQNRSPGQLFIDVARGIGPDEAAAIALYSNPALRAIRDRRGLAAAQLIQAGILPNPVVSYARLCNRREHGRDCHWL